MNLRWTKEIVQATCAKDTRERVMGGDVDSKAPPKRPTDKKATPKQRMDHHAKLYKETLKGVEGNVKQLRRRRSSSSRWWVGGTRRRHRGREVRECGVRLVNGR